MIFSLGQRDGTGYSFSPLRKKTEPMYSETLMEFMNCSYAKKKKKSLVHIKTAAVTYYGNATWTLHLYSREVMEGKGYTITSSFNSSPEQERPFPTMYFLEVCDQCVIGPNSCHFFQESLKLSLILRLWKGERNAYACTKEMILIWVSLVCDLMSVLSNLLGYMHLNKDIWYFIISSSKSYHSLQFRMMRN